MAVVFELKVTEDVAEVGVVGLATSVLIAVRVGADVVGVGVVDVVDNEVEELLLALSPWFCSMSYDIDVNFSGSCCCFDNSENSSCVRSTNGLSRMLL